MPPGPSARAFLAEAAMKTCVRLAESPFAVSVPVGAGGQTRSSIAAAQTFWDTWFLPCGADRLGVRLQGTGKEAVAVPA